VCLYPRYALFSRFARTVASGRSRVTFRTVRAFAHAVHETVRRFVVTTRARERGTVREILPRKLRGVLDIPSDRSRSGPCRRPCRRFRAFSVSFSPSLTSCLGSLQRAQLILRPAFSPSSSSSSSSIPCENLHRWQGCLCVNKVVSSYMSRTRLDLGRITSVDRVGGAAAARTGHSVNCHSS